MDDTTEVYLKRNALIEPLFNQWYGWSYLLSPATAAMFIANAHVKLMQSFVASPQIHVSALKNPAMRGGPFLDIDPSRAPEVKALLDKTTKNYAHMIEFAEAVKATDKMLSEEAKGFTLEGLYRKIPEPIRGFVELVYDARDNPSIRFVEGLLYKSKYYQTSSHGLCFSLMRPDKRDFVLSTPRLKNPGEVMFDVPWTSSSVDDLYRMRYRAAPFGKIRDAFGLTGEDAENFKAFFTTEAPKPRTPYAGTAPRLRYFGHACVLIEAPGVNIMFDPIVSYDFDDTCTNRFTHVDVPETIDYVFITHNHQDHVMFEPLLELRHRIKTVIVPRSAAGNLVDPSLKMVLKNFGFTDVREMDEMEEMSFPGGTIQGIPFFGEHGDLDVRTKLAYYMKINGHKILMMADSNNIEEHLYHHTHDVIGDVDAVFIGMECDGAPMSWLYGPLFTKPLVRKNDQSRRFDGSNYEKAQKIVDVFHPKQVYVYAMGQEPWLRHMMNVAYTEESRPIIDSNKLVETARSRGMTAERLYLKKELFFE